MAMAEDRKPTRSKVKETGRTSRLADEGRAIAERAGVAARTRAAEAGQATMQGAQAAAAYARRHPVKTTLVTAGLLAGAGVLANPAARLAALRGAAALWRFARPSVTRSAAAKIATMGAARLRDARGSAAR
ncbi:MAG: hypothetical protein A2790_15075 [Phenylobacterium sp. RIFCSPHIGHO2_01_FULL_69_31]|nr:hypothetical protein [Phenylobacterium sp. RIFCSPHIGHO2_01_FULL_69_31]OHB31465.1 MAG: hypothetical protein A2790_15075 [Phenylobacterium sp. RIFCSPHIGHO2_01_FULL_69_31]